MNWSKIITDLHEQLSPNKGLAKLMDLHNNRIGRELLSDFSRKEEEEAISVLQQMAKEAIKVASPAEIEEEKKKLVFIEKLRSL